MNAHNVCGEEDTEVSHNFNRGYNCALIVIQQGKILLGSNLILLDSCSMWFVCTGRSLLYDV